MSDIEKLPLTSMDVAAERIEKLKEIFPEAFMEGKVDRDALLRSLGQWVEPGKERFGLTWPGKAECMKVIQTPSVGTLLPMRDESVNFDTTENLIIEGDNLEALKLLQKSYFGKVKMIYIDPPYNTGKEFIYPDNYSETLKVYLQYSGQVDSEGNKFSTNTESEGRFHSKWLSMMYSRLFLARNLLNDDGVIFISIDEHEVDNLRLLCNEIFGEECFVSLITVLCNPKGRSQDKYFATNNEYILVFSKSVLPKGTFSIEKDEEQVEAEYPEEDEGGKYRLLELRNTHREFGRHNRKNLFYPFFVEPETGNVQLKDADDLIKILPIWEDGFEGCWTWEPKKSANDIDFLVAKEIKGQWKIFRKNYASGADKMLKTIFIDKEYYTERGQKTFNQLFGTKDKIFQSPKSHLLISQLISTCTDNKSIVLDFFPGSGTCAHSVLELNNLDGGNRKFILVQLPEPTNRDDYKTISEITRERVRRVIKQLNEVYDGKLDLDGIGKQDRGFKSFKLSSSNFKVWDGDADKLTDINETLSLFADNILPDRSPEDILYELLLKAGFPLTAPIEKFYMAGKDVYSIAEGALLICLDKELTLEVIEAMVERKPSQILCLDEGFNGNDQLKVNAVQTVKSCNRNEESDIVFRVV